MNKLTAEKCRYRIKQLKTWGSINNRGITAREEDYIQALEIALPILEQQERGGVDWIEWRGSRSPVSKDVVIDIKTREGEIIRNLDGADILIWADRGLPSDITAYRIIPERATNQNGEAS